MREILYNNYFWKNDLVQLRAWNENDWEWDYYNNFDTSAMKILLEYAFMERRLNKYCASLIDDNVGSTYKLLFHSLFNNPLNISFSIFNKFYFTIFWNIIVII